MIELLVNIPEAKQRLVEELINELGGEVVSTHKEHKRKPGKEGKKKSSKIQTKEASDHTYLFDKWKDYEIDIAKIREEA